MSLKASHFTKIAAKNNAPHKFPKVTTSQFNGRLHQGIRRFKTAIGKTF